MQRRIRDIYDTISHRPARTAWEKGVRVYAEELFGKYVDDELCITDIDVRIGKVSEQDLLRGAQNWQEYSRRGMSLSWDREICDRLCTKYMVKKTQHGMLLPPGATSWRDYQAKALEEAAQLVIWAVNLREVQ